MENDYDDETNPEEQIFHNNVREQIIFLLLFALLYFLSFVLLGRFKRKGREDYYSSDEDEVTVYRISTWLCTCSLAVSIGAVLLLPISIISNEILIIYPNSYYIKWLNSSLIQGLWNYVFLFSNVSLFIILPFAYLFTESEGFSGHRKGLAARVYETFTVLTLLGVVVLGLTYVISALVDRDAASFLSLLNLWTYLPFLYSCISFLGVLMLLVCTPLGFVRLFDVVSQFLIKPQFLRDINEEFYACALEEECLRRRLKHAQNTGKSYVSPAPISVGFASPTFMPEDEYKVPESLLRLRNGQLQSGLGARLAELEARRKLLDKQRHTSFFRRNVLHPVAMILLIGLTLFAVLLVVQNTLSLLIGIKALPLSSKQFTLGVSSLSKLGPFGAALEILLILYFIATSSIGLYTAPVMSRIRPRTKSTPFCLIIANCAVILILSSALPVLSKILGITNFDLLGEFGSIEWLGNFEIVLLYNLSFALAATLCVVNKFTAKVRRELYARDDCPNFAHASLVAEHLKKHLPRFSYLLVRRTAAAWNSWLADLNQTNEWYLSTSPVIWKHITRTGGKPYLIGGLSEFWEYVYDYYGFQSFMPRDNLMDLVADNLMLSATPEKEVKIIGISGASHPMTSLLICELEQAIKVGHNREWEIRLYQNDRDYDDGADNLVDVLEEFVDFTRNNPNKISLALSRDELIKDCDLLIILDQFPKYPTEDTDEWLCRCKLFVSFWADDINDYAKWSMRVIFGQRPACFNATILMQSCTSIRPHNIVAVTAPEGITMIDMASKMTHVPVGEMGCPPVWGIPGIASYVDVESIVTKATVFRPFERATASKDGAKLPKGHVSEELRFLSYLLSKHDAEHIREEAAVRKLKETEILKRIPFLPTVRAIGSLLKLWYADKPDDDIISLGVCSNGCFGFPLGIAFSQPVKLDAKRGIWVPFGNFPLTESVKIRIQEMLKECKETIEMFFSRTSSEDDTSSLLKFSVSKFRI